METEEKSFDEKIKDALREQRNSLEKTGKKLIIFWFIIGLILGALIF
ncbi:hypothetical protein L6250_01505 [Candidatus Parcubacteria bacterium]|nr:hypothetical protein [Candidatus Parcubacteria bacterium]